MFSMCLDEEENIKHRTSAKLKTKLDKTTRLYLLQITRWDEEIFTKRRRLDDESNLL